MVGICQVVEEGVVVWGPTKRLRTGVDMKHDHEHGNTRKSDAGEEGRAGQEESWGRQD